MAKTVDQFSTIENFRTKYNELAVDVGELLLEQKKLETLLMHLIV